MATTKANLRQTAFNVAATLTAAEVGAGFHADLGSARQAFYAVAEEVFQKLVEEHEAEAASEPERRAAGVRGAAGARGDDVETALATELKYGAFKGLTLGQVLGLSPKECAEYGYGDGNRTGRDYIAWLASPQQENKFLQKRARVIIEAAQAGLI